MVRTIARVAIGAAILTLAAANLAACRITGHHPARETMTSRGMMVECLRCGRTRRMVWQ